jgi:tRNA threonylcarbamoyladenosine biosynthesis protein TsaE
MMPVRTRSAAATRRVAGKLALLLEDKPALIFLHGVLGSGKTTFVQGFAAGLESTGEVFVKSPTFALANTYPTLPPIHHLDLYRLEGEDMLESLGLLEMLDDGASHRLLEWPERLGRGHPLPDVQVFFPENASASRKLRIAISDPLRAQMAPDWAEQLTRAAGPRKS